MGMTYGQHGCYYYVDLLLPKSLTIMCIFLSRDRASCSTQPFFPGKKIIVFQAFEHPCLKLLFQYPKTYTLQSLNRGCRTSTSLRQPLWSYSESYRHLLAYYKCFQTSTRLLQSFPNIYYTSTVTAELEQGLPNMY